MKYYSKIFFLFFCVLLFSCSEDLVNEKDVGDGSISISIEQDESLNIKKAAAAIVYSVQIVKRGTAEVVYTADDASILPSSITLKEGNYTMKASSVGAALVGFDNPKYAGTADFTVIAGETTAVSLKCTLQNVKVSVAFGQAIQDNFDDYSVKIITGADQVTFLKGEIRSAYVPVAPFNVEVTLTDKIGRVHTITNTITEVAARDHFKFVVDLVTNTGNGSINITVDPTTYDKIVDLNVFDKVPVVMTLPPTYIPTGVVFNGKKLDIAGECTFEYRIKSTDTWKTIDPTLMTFSPVVDGVQSFSADASAHGIPFGIEAEYRAVFKSRASLPQGYYVELLPNLNFDTWHQNGKTWYPNASGGNSFWATGNEGVNMFPVNKDSNTIPVTDDVQGGSGSAVRLQTISVPLVKIAAGNIFTGKYKTNTSNPGLSVTFGRPWKFPVYRPTTLRGYYKYKGVAYDGKDDFCHIYVRFENWGNAVDRPASPVTVGYGEFKTSASVDVYTAFNASITYSSDLPITHVVLVATSSIEGEAFKGGVGSLLYIDNFELF